MNSKRLLKSPWFFILIAAILGLVLPSLLSGGDGYTSVKTSVALAQLQDGNVKSATIKDKEQLLELTLNNGIDPTGDGNRRSPRSRPRTPPTRARRSSTRSPRRPGRIRARARRAPASTPR